MLKLFQILIFLLIPIVGFSQSTDEKLAFQYFNNKEYDKAVIYFEKLYSGSYEYNYYANLLECYINLNEQKNAEKLVKKQIKKHPFNLFYIADLGYVNKKFGNSNKAKQYYEDAIKELSTSNQQIIDLASNFIKRKELNYAIKTYLKGRKLIGHQYPFNFELAEVYNQLRQTENMLNEYISILDRSDAYLQSVQNALQTSLEPDPSNEKKDLLKSILIKKIQKNPNNKVFAEMLIWVYIQEKNFKAALLQTKALDKRLKEKGNRVLNLAKLSLSNKDYSTAIDCYKYVIEKGSDNYYYSSSKMELVNVYNKKLTETNNYTKQDLIDLENLYLSTLNELGISNSTSPLLRGLANIQAFYLHNPKKALETLNKAINIPGLKNYDKSNIKLDLADVYLMLNNIWEASLLYSQVEKDYKYDRLGEIAKFNNAKISYYTGDFEWAKAQLDVLKASTSKLIANDAMQLSLIITDNIGIDTTTAPLKLFSKADLLVYQNNNEKALLVMDSITMLHPTCTLHDDVLYLKYKINLKQKNFNEAAENLKKITSTYHYELLADDATFNLAKLYENNLNNKEEAAEYYKKILFDFNDSIYLIESRKRYRALQD